MIPPEVIVGSMRLEAEVLNLDSAGDGGRW